MISEDLELIQAVAQGLKTGGWQIATAESCTGGGLAQQLTSVSGSSGWFERGFVTYSNLSKVELLEVEQQVLDTEGAVSRRTARQMALGALHHSRAHLAVSTTGIAGPTGGTEFKPVGLVWFGWAVSDGSTGAYERYFTGSRHEVVGEAIKEGVRLIGWVIDHKDGQA